MTKDNVQDKIIEIDLRIKALQDLKQKSDNVQGFNTLITNLELRKSNLLKTRM